MSPRYNLGIYGAGGGELALANNVALFLAAIVDLVLITMIKKQCV